MTETEGPFQPHFQLMELKRHPGDASLLLSAVFIGGVSVGRMAAAKAA